MNLFHLIRWNKNCTSSTLIKIYMFALICGYTQLYNKLSPVVI